MNIITNEIGTATGVSPRRWLRRSSSAAAIVAIVAAAVGLPATAPERAPGASSVVAIARADCPPDCGGGPGNGGTPSGPPGGGTEFVPPSMPAMPSYEPGRGQPPLDQNNGISIYNSAAPQPSQAAQPSQASTPNKDGSYNRAANGEQQPVNYNQAPQNQEVSREFLLKQQQLNQDPDNPTQAAAELHDQQSNTAPNNQLTRPLETEPPQPSQKFQCTPDNTQLVLDQFQDFPGEPDMPRSFSDAVNIQSGDYYVETGDPVGDPSAPMRVTVHPGDTVSGTTFTDDAGADADIPPGYDTSVGKSPRVITVSTVPNSNLTIGQITVGRPDGFDGDFVFGDLGSSVFQDPGPGAKWTHKAKLPFPLAATTAYLEPGSQMVDLIASVTDSKRTSLRRSLWQVPLADLLNGKFTSIDQYFQGNLQNDVGLGQGTLTRVFLPDGQEAWALIETPGNGVLGVTKIRIAKGDIKNLLSSHGNPVKLRGSDGVLRDLTNYYGGDLRRIGQAQYSLLTSYSDHGYGFAEGRGIFTCAS